MRLVTAAERRDEATRKTSIVVCGRAKVGKTSLVATLPSDTTLAVDIEAGLKSVEGRWDGGSIPITSWLEAVNLACLLGGPDPARPANQNFSDAHHAYCVE